MHHPVHYKPARGGHAPGYLRDAFLEWVDANWRDIEAAGPTMEYDGESVPVGWVLGMLWNCTDILPSAEYELLDLAGASTYAAAVRKVKELRAA